MAILRAVNVGKSFGASDLFSGVTVAIPRRARIGLVGPNGCGKTTLLQILAGLLKPDAGRVQVAKGVRIGTLPQEAAAAFAGREATLGEVMLESVAPLREQEAALEELAASLSREPGLSETLERYGRLQEAFERAGGYTYGARIRHVLLGLGFPPSAIDQPIEQLSGGQKTRALLAGLLLEQPDLLMLDEPTNHLEVEAVEWLEGYLSAHPSALLLVSHDRTFLDRVVDTIWELSPRGVELYRGNYTAYLAAREERWRRRRYQYEAFLSRSQKELEFIRRTMAAQNTGVAIGRLARLSREVDAVLLAGLAVLDEIDRVGWAQATAGLALRQRTRQVDEVASRLAQVPAPRPPPTPFRISLQPQRRGGDWVLRAQDLTVGYPDCPLLTVPELAVQHGERIAILGGNGTGKTTLLRTLLGELAPLGGHVRLGANLDIGYLPQISGTAGGAGTVLEAVLEWLGGDRQRAMGYLAEFRFGGDMVNQPLASLSGGERTRLALARLALGRPNCLFLDEPTNHLDLPSQEVLQAALASFCGTIVMVSHDRYLVDHLATRLWVIEAGRLEVLASGDRRSSNLRAWRPSRSAPAGGSPSQGKTPLAAADGQVLSKNERYRLRVRCTQLETRIAQLEAEANHLAAELQAASECGNLSEVDRLSRAYGALTAEIDAAYQEWAETAAVIEG